MTHKKPLEWTMSYCHMNTYIEYTYSIKWEYIDLKTIKNDPAADDRMSDWHGFHSSTVLPPPVLLPSPLSASCLIYYLLHHRFWAIHIRQTLSTINSFKNTSPAMVNLNWWLVRFCMLILSTRSFWIAISNLIYTNYTLQTFIN